MVYMKTDTKKICIVSTIPLAINVFMVPHIEMLLKQYDVTLMANGDECEFILPKHSILNKSLHIIPIKIERNIHILRDIQILWKLIRFFKYEKFDVIHTILPKAGLLGMLAAKITNVPIRIHIFTGQVWVTKNGMFRSLLKAMDMLIAKSATLLLADSFTQRDFLIQEKILTANKISVLGNGSVCGIDTNRFRQNHIIRGIIRKQLKINDHNILCLYMGRFTIDKGVLDLSTAFLALAKRYPHAHLMYIGTDEGNLGTVLSHQMQSIIDRFHILNFVKNPEDYLAAADIFCLPSYREGFSNVVIMAASTGLPILASKIYGITDSVVDSETGILHEPKNIKQIEKGLEVLITSHDTRQSMARLGQNRVHSLYATPILVNAMKRFYENAFKNQNHA